MRVESQIALSNSLKERLSDVKFTELTKELILRIIQTDEEKFCQITIATSQKSNKLHVLH